MNNRLKSIMLANAVFAIVTINNIVSGTFDRVDARPKYPIERSILDVQVDRVIQQNYSEEQIVSVSCSTKAGEVCPNSVVFRVRPSQPRNLIKLTALSSCSALTYQVTTPDGFISSILVQPGKTDILAAHRMEKGSSYSFRVSASGNKGACGTRGSWSAKVSLDMYQPKYESSGGPE